MAECHPVGFQWVMEAKRRGATIIHVDPRFTRTSAVADIHVPIRAGTDIAFLGGIVRYILRERAVFPRVRGELHQRAGHHHDEFQDTEELDGIFSGWQKGQQARMATSDRKCACGGYTERSSGPDGGSQASSPDCVFQILKRHFARYTPEMVEEICGVPRELFLQVAETLCGNSGRERTGAFCYAVGWTQHSVGVQFIRTAAIIQRLLGNMGRPGRRHPGAARPRLHPGLHRHPDALQPAAGLPADAEGEDGRRFRGYVRNHTAATGWWSEFPKYMVSLLKAWFGDAARQDNDWCFDYLPQPDRRPLAHDHLTPPWPMARSRAIS